MCIYDSPEESTEAFKKIWAQGYGNAFPSWRAAQVWTGNDHPETWLNNVTITYNQL